MSGLDCVGQKSRDTKKLSNFKQTDFLLTLENKFSPERNSVYCSSFQYAWDKLRQVTKTSFEVDSSLNDLYLLNRSTSFLNTLTSGEYTAISSVRGNVVSLKSSFTKSLPYEQDLYYGHLDFTFKGKRVSSFGSYGDGSSSVEIIYYKDDDNFIIRLVPKDSEHEIILLMMQNSYHSLGEVVSEIAEKTKKRQIVPFTDYDILDIPVLGFNIEANYPTIEGKRFRSKSRTYSIATARQKTSFILNAHGGEVESNGEAEVVFSEPVVDEEIKPKNMLVNKPFFLMFKRRDNINPYFAIWVANTELMTTY